MEEKHKSPPHNQSTSLSGMLRVLIIGPGKVGRSFSNSLQPPFVCVGLWGRKETWGYSPDRLKKVPAGTHLVLLTIPDHEIDHLVTSLEIHPSTQLAHVSGILPAFRRGGKIISKLHPAGSFAEVVRMKAFEKLGFLIEHDPTGILRRLVFSLGGVPVEGAFPPALYHAACVFASNYLNTLAATADELFEKAGLSPHQARAFTQGLQKSVLANLEHQSPLKSLTGPIQRGDQATVESHLKSLEKYPELLQFYKAMGLRTIEALDGSSIIDQIGSDPFKKT